MMKTHRKSSALNRHGLTLLEVVVTVFIIGLLLSLLIPAVQYAREASRRTHCLNNLRQIQLGISGYEATYGCFPQLRNRHGSFLVAVLPFIELSNVARDVAKYREDPWPRGSFNIEVPLYLCASDGADSGRKQAASNYCGNTGSWVKDRQLLDGIFRSFTDYGFGAGVVRARDVSDGLSNTDCLSEWLRADLTFDRMRTVWNTPDRYDDRYSFSKDCRAIPAEPRNYGWEGNTGTRGTPWYDGNIMVTGFNHVCVPNSPSCFNGSSVPFGAASVNSNHSGIVNLTFADGHLKSVSSSIDADVWFDFGSRDGGSVSPSVP